MELAFKKIINMIYPVGSYYETSNTSFDPNKSFGGTWVQDTVGYCTIGADVDGDSGLATTNNAVAISVGQTLGEKNHTLTTSEMPKHSHTYDKIKDTGRSDSHFALHYNLDASWGAEKENGASTSQVGSGTAHNNVQPSIGVIRWHRTK